MSNILIPVGQIAVINLGAQDDTNTFRSLSLLTATISDSSKAYIAATGPAGQFAIVPKPAGQGQTVTVTVNGKSSNGTDLPPLSIGADMAADSAPQATHLVVVGQTVGVFTPPADPGTGTITIPVS